MVYYKTHCFLIQIQEGYKQIQQQNHNFDFRDGRDALVLDATDFMHVLCAFKEFAKLQMNCPAKIWSNQPPTLIKEALPDLWSVTLFPFSVIV